MKKLITKTIMSQSSSSQPPHQEGSLDFDTQTIDQVQKPRMYKVLMLNDDYSPMDFVILVLKRFFGKNEEEATKIMWDVHKKGSGLAGVYTLEVAEMKTLQANQFSKMNQHPLKCIFEPE